MAKKTISITVDEKRHEWLKRHQKENGRSISQFFDNQLYSFSASVAKDEKLRPKSLDVYSDDGKYE